MCVYVRAGRYGGIIVIPLYVNRSILILKLILLNDFIEIDIIANKTVAIKTHSSESQGQEEAACARLQAYATTTVSYLHGWQL